MRRASCQGFRLTLAAFSDRVVLPVLRHLSAVQKAPQTLVDIVFNATYRGPQNKRRKVYRRINKQFWSKNGRKVIAEYVRCRTWIDCPSLKDPPPSTKFLRHPQVRFLFNDVFYGAGLSSKKLWQSIQMPPYNRRALCELFLRGLRHSVCPYCDIDTIRGGYYFDHFVPRVQNPYLAVDPRNLYVVCSACNSPQLGKGKVFLSPISLPCREGIGNQVTFAFSSCAIFLDPGKKPRVRNFLSLLKLPTRYKSSAVFRDVIACCSRVFESYTRSRIKASRSRLLEYHRSNYSEEPLYFASRAALSTRYLREKTIDSAK